jgi:hypothetical protein
MLKNLFKATVFYTYSHECTFNVQRFFKIGWLAKLKGYKVSLGKLFQHICLYEFNKSYAIGGVR